MAIRFSRHNGFISKLKSHDLTEQKPRVAIIGCGLIGQKRTRSVGNHLRVTACCDVDMARALALAKTCDATPETDWRSTICRGDVDIVFVCTTHDLLPVIAEAAALAGKHVLVEKPGARFARELDAVQSAAEKTGAIVRIGFNHRYHRAFRDARKIWDSGVLQELMFLRARYGHGGRLGYEREWRAIPEISGGGEAIDQGMHLLDLARWFMGDLKLVSGRSPTYFWNARVEDNAFFLLETERRQIAFLHASWTEWKNLFSFEIFGRMGKLEITGLGGSYGVERLAHYQMSHEMGPPVTTISEYPMTDDSWEREIEAFLEDIGTGRQPQPGVSDAKAALTIIEQLYERSRE